MLDRGVRIDGLAEPRRLRDDRSPVTWPMRRAAHGELHPIIAIVDGALRRRVEAAAPAEALETARRAGTNRR